MRAVSVYFSCEGGNNCKLVGNVHKWNVKFAGIKRKNTILFADVNVFSEHNLIESYFF